MNNVITPPTFPVIEMNNSTIENNAMMFLSVHQLKDAPWKNSRLKRNEKKFSEFKYDVFSRGVIQPIIVRQISTSNTFEVLAGYGRRDAVIELLRDMDDYNKHLIPCFIKQVSDAEAQAIMLAENTQREALSAVDEAANAQLIVASVKGDLDEACQILAWEKIKLQKRLQLMRCREEVRKEIGHKQKSGFILTLAHADILSRLEHEKQLTILNAVFKEKWDSKTLKKYASQAFRSLGKAKFNQSECDDCKFNTSRQVGLFDDPISGECSNLPCYKSKTDEWLESTKQELKKDYGQVIFLTQVESAINTITTKEVGESFYNESCLSCSKFTAVLNDKLGEEGEIIKDQCLDETCFMKSSNAYSMALTNETVLSKENKSNDGNRSSTVTVKAKSQSTATNEHTNLTPSSKVLDHSKDAIRATTGAELLTDEVYVVAVTLTALCKMTGFKGSTIDLKSSSQELIPQLMDQSAEVLQQECLAAIQYLTMTATNEITSHHLDPMKMVLLLTSLLGDSATIAAEESWKADKVTLSLMTKPLRLQAMKLSGFLDSYTRKHSEKGAKSLINLSTDKQVDEILSHEFDWSSYCPSYHKDLIQ